MARSNIISYDTSSLIEKKKSFPLKEQKEFREAIGQVLEFQNSS